MTSRAFICLCLVVIALESDHLLIKKNHKTNHSREATILLGMIQWHLPLSSQLVLSDLVVNKYTFAKMDQDGLTVEGLDYISMNDFYPHLKKVLGIKNTFIITEFESLII